jgi:serine/threonine-protein kinase
MDTDRNLLFGVLALQADLLDNDRFAEACSAWAARKDIPLADLLVQRGWLTPEDRADVDKLLARKLARHNGDARAGLAEVTTDEMRHSLAGVADPEVQWSLLGQRPTVTATTSAYTPQGRGRYQLTRLHATGGIGQVWLARDSDLGREVALKELRPERQDHPAAQTRFLAEACITGQLEHPGIVPVHELVRPADGPPFYTMRMVRGRTLSEAVRDYHEKQRGGRAGPRELRRMLGVLELRRLLGAFVAVCNAVAYAHSRGVLHRDLKPANVALGDYGEVVVLDWGLARLVSDTSPPATEDATSLLPVSLEGDSHQATVQGQVLGTPPYMAPEQAEGRLDLLSPATDVYGLGAVLYEILTGGPPFTGPSDEVVRRVAREEPPRPRQCVPATPAALEAVCLKALAKKPAERYPSATELAREVERWLADEPVRAWREPWHVRGRRWARRNRSLVSAAAAALLAVVLLGGAGAVWLAREQERQQAAAEKALDGAAALQEQARWAEARATLEQTLTQLGQAGPADLRRRLKEARDNLNLLAVLDSIRLDRATFREGSFDDTGTARRYALALAQVRLEVGGDQEEAARRVTASPLREALVAVLDDWAGFAREPATRAWLLGVARRADPHVWRDRLRDAGLWQQPEKLARLVQQAPADVLTPPLAAALGSRLKSSPEGEALLRAALLRQPGDFWLLFHLGQLLTDAGKPEQGEGYFRAALALRPGNSAASTCLGWALSQQGKLEEAERFTRKALELDPRNSFACNDLGWILHGQGKLADADRLYRQALDIDPRNAMAHNNLGWLLETQGKSANAEKLYRQAIAIDPRNTYAHNNLGNLLRKQGKAADAEKQFRQVLQFEPRDTATLNNLGNLLLDQGKLVEAEKLYREALAVNSRYDLARRNLTLVTRMIPVQDHWPAFVQGKFEPQSNEQRLGLALLCLLHKHSRAAALLYRDAFDDDPKLADDLQAAHRYDAACAAARAGIGLGAGAAQLDDRQKARMRTLARQWLQADLALYARLLAGGGPAERTAARTRLRHWQGDSDLAGVRDPAALAKLPEAERQAWQELWGEVVALLARAGGK